MAISPKLLNDGESVVLDTRTHPKALVPAGALLIALLVIGVLVHVYTSNDTLHLVVWVLVAIAVVILCVVPLLSWLTSTYTLTDRRLITRTGIITRRGHDIPLARISDVASEKGLLDRMFGCGTLVISDASTNGWVRLVDIPHVEDAQRRVTALLHETHSSRDDEGA